MLIPERLLVYRSDPEWRKLLFAEFPECWGWCRRWLNNNYYNYDYNNYNNNYNNNDNINYNYNYNNNDNINYNYNYNNNDNINYNYNYNYNYSE